MNIFKYDFGSIILLCLKKWFITNNYHSPSVSSQPDTGHGSKSPELITDIAIVDGIRQKNIYIFYWPFMTIHDASWQCMTLCDASLQFLKFMTIHYNLWQSITTHDNSWNFMSINDALRCFMALMTIQDTSWRFVKIHDVSW